MSTGARVAAAMASGYLLGRRRKIKLAIMVGGLLAGKRIATSPQGLLKQANEYIDANPELAKISESVRTTLLDSARQAAVGTASGGIERLSDAIHDRTDKLNTAIEAGGSAGSEATDDEPAEDEPAEDEPAEDEPAGGETEQGPKRGGGSGRAAKKSTAKKPPPQKSTAKKSPAKKSTVKKTSSSQSSRRSSSGGTRSGAAKKASSSRQTSTRNRG